MDPMSAQGEMPAIPDNSATINLAMNDQSTITTPPLDPNQLSKTKKEPKKPIENSILEEKLRIKKILEDFNYRTREIPQEELIFDEEGLPFISIEDLETTARVLQLFYRYPQVATPTTYQVNTYENHIYSAIRSNAMRWIRPADAPAVKDIIALIKVQEAAMMQSTGIRNERNRKKKLLPTQCGQVIINHERHEALMYHSEVGKTGLLENINPNQEKVVLNGVISTTVPTDTTPSDGVVNLNSSIPEPIKKMIRIHGVDAFTTHESLPDAAKLNHVLDNDSTAVKDAQGLIVSLSQIKKNFKPVKVNEVNEFLQQKFTDNTDMQDNARNTDKNDNDSDISVEHISKRPRPNGSKDVPIDMSLFRQKHSSNYSESNPQPKAASHFNTSSNKSPTSATVVKSKTVSIEMVTDEDDDIVDESAHVQLDNASTKATTSVKYNRMHNKLHINDDIAPAVGVNDSILAKEFAENDNKIQTQIPSNPNSKFSQRNQKYISKKGLYGGATHINEMEVNEDDEFTIGLDSATKQQHEKDNNNNTDIDHEQDDLYEEDELLSKINGIFKNNQRVLRNPIVCYVCKASFTQLHHFYDRLCPLCSSLNYKKRFQTAPMTIIRKDPLTGEKKLIRRVCLVTGARVKIGYEIVLKLLRAGAFVIATSRFPIDTALRLSQEEDFLDWNENIHVYGIDFRVVSGVEMFVTHLLQTYDRLDMIMNNAAQTIRRPPQFYRHLLNTESKPLHLFDQNVQNIVKDYIPKEAREEATEFASDMLLSFGVNRTVVKDILLLKHDHATDEHTEKPIESIQKQEIISETRFDETMNDSNNLNNEKTGIIQLLVPSKVTCTSTNPLTLSQSESSNSSRFVAMLSLPQSAAIPSSILTQVPLVKGDEDKKEDSQLYPLGIYDKDHQQLDLRPKQTWVLKADEVSTVEMAEVQTVNAMVPFILNTKLKPLMERSGDPGWIINVSSMEGKFRGHKDITHPHTNMAKAALNMFTHTSSRDYAVDNIFMNAVDTGWVTEELPHGIAVHKAKTGFAPPLDEIDGAARCLDPVFTSLLTGIYEFGKFFKDYGEGHW